jgi:glyoxylase-like metal-dependent hydrolase (beta-lactamase superfamily II)
VGELRWRKTVGPVEISKVAVGPMDNNVYVITAGDDALLIDGANEAEAVLEEIGARRLGTIVQTHGHRDHVVALPELVQRTGARVLAHPGDQIPVRTEPIDEGDIVRVGTTSLDVLHTPGHTPGSVCLVLRHDGDTHLFSGDTLFPGGPGGTFGNAQAFATIMRSLDDKLFVLPDSTHVYPGHGADTTIGTERPHVQEWRERGW